MKTKMEKSILNLVGIDGLSDVRRGGADAGFNGFTYYSETCNFFKAHRAEIIAMVKETAEDFGEQPIEMVKKFRCLKEVSADAVAEVIYGRAKHKDCDMVKNGLAWFALETIAARYDR